jgi:hypothetical protein
MMGGLARMRFGNCIPDHDVCFWPKADIASVVADVCSWGQS